LPIPEPNLPDVWQTRIHWLGGSTDGYNVLHVLDEVGSASADDVRDKVLDAFDDAMSATAGVSYRSFIDNPCRLNDIKVTRYDESSPNTSEVTTAGAQFQGTSAADALPPQIAVCLTLRTALASRRSRGRVFLPGWTAAAMDENGRLETTTRTAIIDFWTDVIARLAAGPAPNLAFGILSRGWENEGPQDPRDSYAQAFYVIDSIAVRDTAFDTMRSRAFTS
jgi:hypothetical protein